MQPSSLAHSLFIHGLQSGALLFAFSRVFQSIATNAVGRATQLEEASKFSKAGGALPEALALIKDVGLRSKIAERLEARRSLDQGARPNQSSHPAL